MTFQYRELGDDRRDVAGSQLLVPAVKVRFQIIEVCATYNREGEGESERDIASMERRGDGGGDLRGDTSKFLGPFPSFV